MSASLVGSEMCIRDRWRSTSGAAPKGRPPPQQQASLSGSLTAALPRRAPVTTQPASSPFGGRTVPLHRAGSTLRGAPPSATGAIANPCDLDVPG
eukprot:8120699-Alexandrium_andersonii.AAC.1